MFPVPPDLSRRYDAMLERSGVALTHRPYYRKWLRYYLDFCHKYHFAQSDSESFSAFDDKLRQKNQSQPLRKQAHHAISLYDKITSSANNRNVGAPSAPRSNPEHVAPERKPLQNYRPENKTATVKATPAVLSSASQTTLRSTVEAANAGSELRHESCDGT
jgi:hypothetical protein